MNNRRQKLQAYFAGIFDGEGTVGIYKFDSNTNYKTLVAVQMTEPLAVLYLHREYPEGVLSRTNKGHYRFVLNGNNAYRFLKEIKSYSIVKHPQVKVALSFLVAQRRWRAGDLTRDEFMSRAAYLADTIKALKQPDTNGVNSVNALLSHEMREYRAKREDVENDVQILLEGVETRLSRNRQ